LIADFPDPENPNFGEAGFLRINVLVSKPSLGVLPSFESPKRWGYLRLEAPSGIQQEWIDAIINVDLNRDGREDVLILRDKKTLSNSLDKTKYTIGPSNLLGAISTHIATGSKVSDKFIGWKIGHRLVMPHMVICFPAILTSLVRYHWYHSRIRR